jgi:ankyrin repeat protein
MSSKRLRILGNFFLITVLLIPGKAYSQWKLNMIADSIMNIRIDTSDYFPYIYNEALDYNLMIAASKGYSSEIIRLIGNGANIDAETIEGATPLIFAVTNNRLLAVITLLAYKPQLEATTENHETALLIAVKSGYFDVAEMLIREGAEIDNPDRHNATPIHHAALDGYIKIVDMLIYYGASLDLKSVEGTTPLLAAIWAGNTDIADLLIQNGANMEISDNDGYTPFLLSAFYGDTLMMSILYRKGANIYVTNYAKHNALTLTILTGNTYASEFLLKIGKNWGAPGNDALNPYTVASKYERKDVISLLDSNNVPGQLKYEIDQFALTASSRFFVHDIYTGISLSFKEPYLNSGVFIGCDMKLWYTRVLMKDSENLFYQYMDKGALAYAGVFKDFSLTNNPGRYNYSFSTSLMAGYSFGNKLKGTLITAENKFKIIPAFSFKMTKLNLSFSLGLEYVKTDFYHNGPIWFRAGISYNYYFDNVRTIIKPIKWD